MNVGLVAQQSCSLEHDDRVVGKAEIAGKVDEECCECLAKAIVGADRSNSTTAISRYRAQ